MPHLKKAGCLVLVLAVVVLVGRPVWKYYSWRADYNEAEPLVQTVWPMAYAMQEFEKKNGHGPATLAELAAFDDTVNLIALTAYDVTLNPTGNPRLFVRVNRHYHFRVDDQYHPSFEHTDIDSQPGG